MRKDFGPQTWMYPMPVLIIGTYDENGSPNAMNAAWGGIFDYNQIMICLSAHKTTENLYKYKALTISFATEDTVKASDYVGLVSGNKEPNKLEKAGLHPFKSEKVNAPLFEEYPLTLECVVKEFTNEGNGGCNVICEIVNVSAREDVLDEKGKVDVSKLKPLLFDSISNTYRSVGDVFAKAFKVGLEKK